jgi:hypothetical protein
MYLFSIAFIEKFLLRYFILFSSFSFFICHFSKESNSFIKLCSSQSFMIIQYFQFFKISIAHETGTVMIGIHNINDSSRTSQKDSDLEVKQNKDAFFKYL